MHRKLFVAFLILFFVLFEIPKAFSQLVSGSITGYVTDPSVAAVPEATVTATDVNTGVSTTRTTDANGLYVIASLLPATYKVSVEKQGFQRFTQENVILKVDSTVRIDVTLRVGRVSQEITISGAPPTLNTEKTDVNATFSAHTLQALPTIGNNVTALFSLTPGVSASNFTFTESENTAQFTFPIVNGVFFGDNVYEIDGTNATNYGVSGFQVIVPLEDSTQEMKVTTSNFDPEFGSSGGMVAQYVTKSGTNQVHGTAFWFNRNSATFAANPFTEKVPGTGPNGKGTGPAPYNWNQGGFTLGGPIKKNRFFWFGDYQFVRLPYKGNTLATVPNDAFRQGDFSALATPIFDPQTGNPDGTGRAQISCNGALNVICPNRINQVAKNLLALLPSPLTQNTDNNFVGTGSGKSNQDQFDVRQDYNISDKDKFFARYSMLQTLLYGPPIFGIKAGGPSVGGLAPTNQNSRTQNASLNYNHTFSPTLLAEFRFGLVRFNLDEMQVDANLRTDDAVGIPNINTGSTLTGGLAGINIDGPVGAWWMGMPPAFGIPNIQVTTQFQWVSNWTKISGRHQLRWGVDSAAERYRELLASNTRGGFDFCQSLTSSPGAPNSGLGMASFLLGQPCSFNRAIITTPFADTKQTRVAFYGQDVWRVTPKLTVNLGLRWDYFQPETGARPGMLANFDLNTGQVLIGGIGGNSGSGNVQSDYKDFAPRVGIAYKLTNKTVIRSAFGRSYFGGNFGSVFGHLSGQYPLTANQVINPTNVYQSVFPIEQGPPAPAPPVFPASGHFTPIPGLGLESRPMSPNSFPTERSDEWNFTVEHQLAQNLDLSVGYVGNVGMHLWDALNINTAVPGPGSFDSRRPFFNKFGIADPITYSCRCQTSNYNGLQIHVEKRFSEGYSIISSYTWSKSMDHLFTGWGYNDQGPDPYDLAGSYGVSNYDRASVWTLGHVWQLPFARRAEGWKKGLIGGWSFTGITTVESGLPTSPVTSDTASLNADFGQRPDSVGDWHLKNPTRNLWYNPAAFIVPPGCCGWGNAARGSIVGPGLATADWGLWKEIALRESMKLEVRWENFNFFNRTNLGLPNNYIDSSTAGQITNLSGYEAGVTNMRRMQFGLRLKW